MEPCPETPRDAQQSQPFPSAAALRGGTRSCRTVLKMPLGGKGPGCKAQEQGKGCLEERTGGRPGSDETPRDAAAGRPAELQTPAQPSGLALLRGCHSGAVRSGADLGLCLKTARSTVLRPRRGGSTAEEQALGLSPFAGLETKVAGEEPHAKLPAFLPGTARRQGADVDDRTALPLMADTTVL